MAVNLALFEHATGYGLFRVKEFEEIGAFTLEVEASIIDVSRFNGIVSLFAFLPFKTATEALSNMNSISEGIPTDELKLFLQTNYPKKSKKCVLGVIDSRLGGALAESLGIKVCHIGVVPEIIRGIRTHFNKLVKGLTSDASSQAQLGLGHSYSRAKVKFNIHKADNMIIQSIALLDQLDKDINTFSMRIREWYSYHFPELYKIIGDNYMYNQCVKLIKNRKEVSLGLTERLEEILCDSAKAKAVVDASKSSMGMDISIIDLIHIDKFASRVISLTEYRKQLMSYLETKMGAVAPNLCTLIGETVGARLISHAGSLTNLAKCPASTVQILGAEKALFRALKTKGNTPKYGLIFHSSFIGKAGAKNKGRISRYLANKCSIASRIDCFSEIPTSIFGSKLKQQVEDRLKFYEIGEIPKKNLDVMSEAIQALAVETAAFQSSKKKSKKSKKALKRKLEEIEETKIDESENYIKKKKKKDIEQVKKESCCDDFSPKKKKKINVEQNGVREKVTEELCYEASTKKKKKKNIEQNGVKEEVTENGTVELGSIKKKKKVTNVTI